MCNTSAKQKPISKTKRNAKFDYSYVKEYVESEGYKLVSNEYVNNKTKLELVCPNGHPYSVSFSNFKNHNKRCATCSGNARKTIYEVRELASKIGLEVLTDEYINNTTPFIVRCSVGHEYPMTFMNLQKVNGCSKCQLHKIQQDRKFTYDYVKSQFELNGCILLSTEYKDANSKLDYICSCGNKSTITFSDFSQGSKCRKCMGKRISDIKRADFEIIKQTYIDNNCILISSEENYENRDSKLTFICSCGEEYTSSYVAFKKAGNCYKCGIAKQLKSMYENGNVPTSQQQLHICNLLDAELNYPVDKCFLDIAFPNELIYIEYDGSGHNLSVRFGNMTQDEFNKKEFKRSKFLSKLGWREIRITSNDDKLPSDKMLLKICNYAIDKVKNGENHVYINLNDRTINTYNNEIRFEDINT